MTSLQSDLLGQGAGTPWPLVSPCVGAHVSAGRALSVHLRDLIQRSRTPFVFVTPCLTHLCFA